MTDLRPWDYQFGVAVQQQLTSRISAEVQWNKRWFDGYYVSRNTAISPSDWQTYNVTAPVDSRLPGGGGYTVTGLHDIAPTKFGQANYQVQAAGNYGLDGSFQQWSGVDVTVAMRAAKGLSFQGGTSTGEYDDGHLQRLQCRSRGAPGGAGAGDRRERPRFQLVQWRPAVGAGGHGAWPVLQDEVGFPHAVQRALGSYVVPKVNVEVSATYQSKPGALLAANYNMPAAQVAQFLGRAPSGGVANVTMNLVTPGTLYGDRINELDLRFTYVLKVGRTRSKISLDMYNALNSAPILTYNQTYSPLTTTWLAPTSVLAARVMKIGASIDF